MTIDWLQATWPAPPGIIAGTTLRNGGNSAGPYATLNLGDHVGDDTDRVRANRRAFVAACRLPDEPRWLRQVHGTTVVKTSAATSESAADAAVTDHEGVICAVLTADCLPVVFAAADGSEIAVAHAGWRGLSAGILEKTVAAMRTPASAVLAWLGPAISQAAFEVGDEVRETFVLADPTASGAFVANEHGRWQADLYALARLRLARCGVEQVFGGDRCTFREPGAFFSYRRDGACGRMATFAFRKGGNA